MTRTEQEAIVIGQLEKHLQEQPNIREKIGNAFRNWFSSLVQQALQEVVNEAIQGQTQS